MSPSFLCKTSILNAKTKHAAPPYQYIGVKLRRQNNPRVNMKNCAYDFEICYSLGMLLRFPFLLLLLQKQTAEIVTAQNVTDGKTIISNRIIPHIWPLTKDPIRCDD